MKRLLFLIAVVVVLVISAIYIFIPKEIKIAEVVYVRCNETAGYRSLANDSNWKKWQPYKFSFVPNSNSSNYYFLPSQKYTEGLEIIIKKDTSVYYSLISLLPIKVDSVRLEWTTTFFAGSNPFIRVQQYFRAREIKSNMKGIAGNLKSFLEKRENVYGMAITVEKVKDTFLVAKKIFSNSYPDTEVIYNLIDDLRSFLNSKGAKETNYPMLHVATRPGSNGYETMVAIPVNKVLSDSRDFAFKRMVPGNILAAQVTGGISTIKEGEAQLENFLQDYQFLSPAIPFQSLVTNRMNEKDTSKWITKLYYPIL
ncbi:MAG: hypothetical protein WKF91_10030 [Segetibacter sp.]